MHDENISCWARRYPNPKLVVMPILNLTRSDPQYCSLKVRAGIQRGGEHLYKDSHICWTVLTPLFDVAMRRKPYWGNLAHPATVRTLCLTQMRLLLA